MLELETILSSEGVIKTHPRNYLYKNIAPFEFICWYVLSKE